MNKTRSSLKGSGTSTLTKALRNLFRSTAYVAFAAGLIVISGCTASSGPDVALSTYGGIGPDLAGPTQLSGDLATAPDQAPAVVVSANSAKPDPLAAVAEGQSFAPGANNSSSASLDIAALSASPAGAVENSVNYVTDGVEKTAVPATAKPAPLTPSDVAGQKPKPAAEETTVAVNKSGASAALSADANAKVGNEVASDPVVTQKSARPTVAPKKTLFGGLFANKPKTAQQNLTASTGESVGALQLASLEAPQAKSTKQTQSMSALPGVNAKNLFALDPSGKDAGNDGYEEEPEIQVASASAAGLARLAPNGLLKQTDRVDVGCFKPELVSVLKKIESHYGQKVVVTSGYRSPSGNRRAGGSRHSLHMMCAAADIQVSGVGKWELAKYMRSMPGRGGVGTYCYTDSVHIDVGSERDWNWRCRRR